LCGHDEGGECGVEVVEMSALQKETWLHSHSGPPRPEGKPIMPPYRIVGERGRGDIKTTYPSDAQFKEITYDHVDRTVFLQKKSGDQYRIEPACMTH